MKGISDLRFQTIVQAIVTLALLGFAIYMEPGSPGMAQTIVGAVVYHWLRESTQQGQQIARQADAQIEIEKGR